MSAEIVRAESVPHERSAVADLFRAAAILAVIASHLFGYFGGSTDYRFVGDVGVNTFFVLSGFLLSEPYLRATLHPSEPFPSMKTFWSRRFLRIYPLYALAVVTTAAPFLFARRHHGVSISDIAAHLTMTHGFLTQYAQSAFNVPLWTMAVDAQFYILLPICALILRVLVRNVVSFKARLNIVLASLGACVVLSLIARVFAYHTTVAMVDENVATVYARNAVGLGSAFGIGVGLALAKMQGSRPTRSGSYALFGLAVACVAWLSTSGVQGSDNFGVQVMYDLVGAVAAGALLYGFGQGDFPAVTCFAASSVVTSIAAISYGLYLVHKPFSLLAIHLLSHRFNQYSIPFGIGVAMITLVLSSVVAIAAHRFVEVPCLQLKDRLSRRSAPMRGAVPIAQAGRLPS